MLDEYLKENSSSRYQIFKVAGIPQSTLSFYTKKPLKEYPVRILVAIGKTIDKPSWLVLKELIDVEKVILINQLIK